MYLQPIHIGCYTRTTDSKQEEIKQDHVTYPRRVIKKEENKENGQ